jgi:GT2 family glycosyltransferase
MRASIIIVTYGQRDVTERCLRSLEGCLGDRLGTDWELVLVDNASPDDTPELLRAWSSRAVVKLLEQNRDFAGGCNVGAHAASGEVLVFLNNDTEVTPGALEAVVDQALEPGVAAAGCRLLYPDGTVQHAGVAFVNTADVGGTAIGTHIFYHHDQDAAEARASYALDCVTGACLAVRATTFFAVGGFDEGYRNGLEDVDLCLRIRMTGERIVYRGDATIVHHEGASRGRGGELTATPERQAMVRHNILRFVNAWHQHLAQDDDLAAQVWDARLEDRPPARLATTADVLVVGQPSGIGPAADEARALLGTMIASGRLPAALDVAPVTVQPRLSGDMAGVVEQARRRYPVPGAPSIVVPTGAHDAIRTDPATIVRLAQTDTAVALGDVAMVWASCPSLATALVDNGLDGRKVAVVLPPVMPAPLGPGGGGVLAMLPTHDRPLARRLLDALRKLPTTAAIRLIPTVATWHLDRDVAELLPRAQLLGPCSDEARFATMASTADAVVSVDADDPFERRALVAAGVGAAAITPNPAGPSVAVLGERAAVTLDALESRLVEVLADPGDRAERAQQVLAACSPQHIARHLHERFDAAA